MERVDSDEGLLALRPAWAALVEAGGATTPFQSWTTTYHAWRLSSAKIVPAVFTAGGDPGGIAGLLPLGLRSWQRGPFRWRSLESIGPRRVDFSDAVAIPSRARAVLQEIVTGLAARWREWDEIHLPFVRNDALLLAHVETLALPSHLTLAVSPTTENMAIAIPESAARWEDVLGGETRRTTRRIVRRLESEGFTVHRVSAGYSCESAIDALVALHARRRRELGQKSRLLEAKRHRLYEFVAAAIAEGGDLYVMARDETPVAAQWTLRLGARATHYRVAFDSQYRRFSPGVGLLAAAVDDAIASGIREYDFGLGAEEYKRRWANVRRTVHSVRIHNRHAGRFARRAWTFLAPRRRRKRAALE